MNTQSFNISSKPKVIIIGAGASGLTAGEHLLKLGFEVMILEGSDRFGGRLYKDTKFSDYTLDLGGEEIYNPQGEYFKLCLKAGADIFKRKDGCTYIEHPTEKKIMNYDEFYKKHPQEAGVIELFCEHYQKYPRDNRPLSELYDHYELNPLFKFWAIECMGTESGGDWRVMSNRQIGGKEHIFPTFTDCFLMRNMGHYDVLSKVYQSAIKKIKYNKEVFKVSYGGFDDGVTVFTQDGSIYNTDYVICTVSIALLQKNCIKFDPELPKQKINAIQSIGIDPAGKLFLKFKKPIFEQDVKILYLNYMTIFGWLSSDERSKQDYVFIFLIAGEMCSLIDKDPVKFIDDLLEHLQKLTKIPVKDNYDNFLWKNWGADKFIQAGHSFDSIFQTSNTRKILAQNVNERVFFAGEACNSELRHGGINGAVDTGIKVSKEVSNYYISHFNRLQQPKL